MEALLSFRSGPHANKVFTDMNAENWGGKKKVTFHLYTVYYIPWFLMHNFYTMEDKIFRVNMIFSSPSLLFSDFTYFFIVICRIFWGHVRHAWQIFFVSFNSTGCSSWLQNRRSNVNGKDFLLSKSWWFTQVKMTIIVTQQRDRLGSD